MRDKLIKLLSGKSIDTIADVEYVVDELIANGTILLPCKVGDMLYKVVENSIVEYRVHKIEFYITEDKRFGYCLYCDSYALGEFDYFYKKSIGKDVFLTKAEAEERIKGLKEV